MFPSQLKRSPIKRSADESSDWNLNKEMRSRHPMFRLPNWMSDDDDMSNLSSRMSQTPHFGTANMRGPWRERRDSGGHVAGSDSVDGHRIHSEPIQIPIRIEAEAPSGWISPSMHNTIVQEDKSSMDHEKQEPEQTQEEPPQVTLKDPQLCVGNIRKQPQYASRTTSAVNALKQEDIPRDTRCASAPPDMPDPRKSHQFVSSMRVIPQNTTEKSQLGSSPVFNNVPKPYSKVSQTPPICEERTIPTENISNNTQHFTPHFEERQESHPYQQNQPQHQPHWGSPASKSSVVRNIPIMIEGRDEESCSPSRSPQKSCYREDPRWDNAFSNQSYKFPHSYEFSRPDQPSETKQNDHPTHFQYQHFPQPADQRFQERHEQEPFQHPAQVQQQTEDVKLEEDGHKETKPLDIKMNAIDEVRTTVAGYREQAAKFQGLKMDKEYRYLDEMLTRALLHLDDIDPDGRDDVRQARRALVKDINETIANLEKLAKDGNSEVKLLSTAAKEEITLNEESKPKPNCTDMEAIQRVSEKMEPECPIDSQGPADPPQAPSTDQCTEI